MLCREEGIVIRSTDYGEANKIIVLVTPTVGKISLMARGAKRSKSRFFAATQMFTHGQYAYYQSRAGQMGTLNQVEIMATHHPLRADLHSAAYSAYLTELTDRMTAEHESTSLVFGQLLAALEAIEQGKDMEIIARIYELRMLSVAGYAPSFQHCVICNEETDNARISARHGGIVCQRCQVESQEARQVTKATLQLLRLFQHFDLRRLGEINVSTQTKRELKAIHYGLLDSHLHTHWKSRDFIDQMHKYEL